MTQEELKKQINGIEALRNQDANSPTFKAWKRKTDLILAGLFGNDSSQVGDFRKIRFTPTALSWDAGEDEYRIPYLGGLNDSVAILQSMLDEINPLSPKIDDMPFILHAKIAAKCQKLFEDNHYAPAAERGFKVVKDRLRELTTFESGSNAFGKGGLYIKGAATPNVDSDFQQAAKLLTMSIDQFRNEKAHTSDSEIDDPNLAMHYLTLASLAMYLLDRAIVK